MSAPRKKRFVLEVNPALCKECAYCGEVCPQGVFEPSGSLNTSGYQYMSVAHSEKCNGCLKCFMICPDFAISIKVEDEV